MGHKTGNPDIVHDNPDPAKCACNRKPARRAGDSPEKP